MWTVKENGAGDHSIQLVDENCYLWCWLGDIFDHFYCDPYPKGVRVGYVVQENQRRSAIWTPQDDYTDHTPANWVLA